MAVKIENATVYLGGREILHNLSWEVKRGERCFILGANGAGKTTLVKLLMGFAWPVF
ncbi:MAG: ATP-binding cassette domain-containing protein, partial [Victivallaceae bacterium]